MTARTVPQCDADIRKGKRRGWPWTIASIPPLVVAGLVLPEYQGYSALAVAISLMCQCQSAYWRGWRSHAESTRLAPSSTDQEPTR